MARVVHVVGAGLAGLAAALRLQRDGAAVVLHEAAAQAGGRCRSYFDRALNMTIDNGNHLLLSGNRAALDYLRAVGAEQELQGPAGADYPFLDLATRARWTVRLNHGRLPWWICTAARRTPGTRARDYLALAPLLWTRHSGRALRDVLRGDALQGALWERLVRPLFLAVLNTEPDAGDAALAGAVLRETLAAGGRACRPLVARRGLGAAFVEPALRALREGGAQIRFGSRVRALAFDADGARVAALDCGSERIELDAAAVVLAVPPPAAAALLPGLRVPTETRAIVNAHFAHPAPAGAPPLLGLLNGTAEWLFAFEGRLSVTISGADRLLDVPRDELARTLWAEVARAVGDDGAPLPAWQIVAEKRATFAALPSEEAKRPAARTRWRNLALAGDWTATGLPATIEGAIRSGNAAADVLRRT